MISLISEIKKFIQFKLIEKKYLRIFFCENEEIFFRLYPYINNRKKKGSVYLFFFETPSERVLNLFSKDKILVLKNNFIRELFFLTLRVNYLYASTPDLDKTLFKKSKIRKNKYIYLHHSPVSLTAVYNQNAFESFDALQVIGDYQYKELNELNLINNTRIKPLKSKYAFYEENKRKSEKTYIKEKVKFDVLIAPSWNTNFYNTECHLKLSKLFLSNNISFKLRPHKMTLKKKLLDLKQLENNHISLDHSINLNFYNFDFLISDWSGIFIEYFLLRKKKPILINTSQKIGNGFIKNKYKENAVENKWRKEISYLFDLNEIHKIPIKILFLKENNTEIEKDLIKANEFKKKNFY